MLDYNLVLSVANIMVVGFFFLKQEHRLSTLEAIQGNCPTCQRED